MCLSPMELVESRYKQKHRLGLFEREQENIVEVMEPVTKKLTNSLEYREQVLLGEMKDCHQEDEKDSDVTISVMLREFSRWTYKEK